MHFTVRRHLLNMLDQRLSYARERPAKTLHDPGEEWPGDEGRPEDRGDPASQGLDREAGGPREP